MTAPGEDTGPAPQRACQFVSKGRMRHEKLGVPDRPERSGREASGGRAAPAPPPPASRASNDLMPTEWCALRGSCGVPAYTIKCGLLAGDMIVVCTPRNALQARPLTLALRPRSSTGYDAAGAGLMAYHISRATRASALSFWIYPSPCYRYICQVAGNPF